jgi:hypothetical protein
MEKLDYKGKYKKQVEKNLKQVLKELNGQDVSQKISNWANKFNYSFDVIKQKIIDDEIFRCVFIKEPGRQGFHEKIAAEYIKSLDKVNDFKKLPNGGKDAIYLTNGKIFKGSDLNKKSKETKSIDFTWKTGKFTIYATHKYTGIDGSGGSQDNQYEDVQKFIKNAVDCNEENCILLAICDGDYYKRRDSKTDDETKIKRLERLTDNKTVFVKTIDDLALFLKNLTL